MMFVTVAHSLGRNSPGATVLESCLSVHVFGWVYMMVTINMSRIDCLLVQDMPRVSA